MNYLTSTAIHLIRNVFLCDGFCVTLKKTKKQKQKTKTNNLYLPSAVGLSIQIEHNVFKNPNWQEADQLAI